MQELLVNNSDNQNSNSLSVSSAVFQNAGATITQQLAYSLAETHYYLTYLDEKGLLDELNTINYQVAIGGNYFFEIAKIKALRWLHDTLVSSFDTKITCHITATPPSAIKLFMTTM